MTPRESFIAQLGTQPLVPGDAIVLLQGDGHNRVAHTIQLFEDGYAPVIVLVGGDTRREYGSAPSSELKEQLVAGGVPEGSILLEETATHTRAEAERLMELAQEHGWKNLLIVTSPHHIFRAFLTFLAAMRDKGMTLVLQPAPARNLRWYAPEPWGKRAELLDGEFRRIDEYGTKGHVATFEDGLEYLEWKEANA